MDTQTAILIVVCVALGVVIGASLSMWLAKMKATAEVRLYAQAGKLLNKLAHLEVDRSAVIAAQANLDAVAAARAALKSQVAAMP